MTNPTTQQPHQQQRRGGGGDQRRGGGGGNRDNRDNRRRNNRGGPAPAPVDDGPELFENVVFINRCAKVVKGGRRFSFSALVVVGDQKGKVGVGYGKAKEVPNAVTKGIDAAKKAMVPVQLRGETIPHPVTGVHDGGRVLLRPATAGTGVIAGGGVRAVLEAAGIKNVLSKSLGSNNAGAVVNATLDALLQLRSFETIRKLRADIPEEVAPEVAEDTYASGLADDEFDAPESQPVPMAPPPVAAAPEPQPDVSEEAEATPEPGANLPADDTKTDGEDESKA